MVCTDSRGGLCCGYNCPGGDNSYPFEDEPESWETPAEAFEAWDEIFESGHGPDCINDMYADAGVTGFMRRRGNMYDINTLIHAASESNLIEQVVPGRTVFDAHINALVACKLAAEDGVVIPPRVLHWMLFQSMAVADNEGPSLAGQYRTEHNVWVGGHRFPTPDKVAPMMASLWQVVSYCIANVGIAAIKPGTPSSDTELGSQHRWDIHAWFESIHPFTDGNGRVGRLLWWNLEMLAGVPLTIIEYAKRSDYYDLLDDWRRLHGNKPLLNPFVGV